MREGGANTATVQVDNPASLMAREDDAPAEGVAAVPVDQAGVEQQIEWISPAGEMAPQVSSGRIADLEVFDDAGIVQSTGFQISDRFRMTMELKLIEGERLFQQLRSGSRHHFLFEMCHTLSKR